ncbi:hypothetical protein C8R43DRAFT_1000560, partial [Mycena crocata]
MFQPIPCRLQLCISEECFDRKKSGGINIGRRLEVQGGDGVSGVEWSEITSLMWGTYINHHSVALLPHLSSFPPTTTANHFPSFETSLHASYAWGLVRVVDFRPECGIPHRSTKISFLGVNAVYCPLVKSAIPYRISQTPSSMDPFPYIPPALLYTLYRNFIIQT